MDISNGFVRRSPTGFLVAALIAGTVGMSAIGAEKLTLVKDGSANATIVIGNPATKTAQFAAFELQWHLEQMSGAALPIVTADQKTGGIRILVGESDATRELGLDAEDFKPQEYLVRFQADTLILIGNDKPDTGEVKYDMSDPHVYQSWPDFWGGQGTLYATYDFLERHCNVRWFNPSESGTVIPENKNLSVGGTETRRSPFFSTRYAFGGNLNADYDKFNCMWTGDKYKEYEAAAHPELHKKFTNDHQYMLAKRSANSLFLYRMRAGGEKCLCNHSMAEYYDRFWEKSTRDAKQAEYFEKKRPELFAKGYENEKIPPQMCYTSRELIEQVAADAKDYFDKGGYDRYVQGIYPGPQWGENYFAVEPMDNGYFCKCDECRKWIGVDKVAADAPHNYGKFSSYKFNFVNEVAKLVAKTNPDKKIITLAYGSTMACPENLKLEPNVVLDFCFDANRLVYDRSPYKYEVNCLKDWARHYPGHPFQLWLYYTFPNEIANNGKWFAFPGYFAHTIGKQFRLFKKLGVKGIFHCGYGQEVEAYVTYKLMDNPDLDVDTLLDEYFNGVYGAGGKDMKRFYLLVEKTYCSPENYPPYVRDNKNYDHQTEEIAWGWLGTEERMKQLSKFFENAKAAADAGMAKRNVDLFEKSTWSYMLAGRQKYLDSVKSKFTWRIHARRIPFAHAKSIDGDPSKVDWTEALTLSGWRAPYGEPTILDAKVQLLLDEKFLYVRFADLTSASPTAGKRWEIAVSKKREGPGRLLKLNSAGVAGSEYAADGSAVAWDSGAKPSRPAEGKKNYEAEALAIPLDKLGDGLKPEKMFMNFRRVSKNEQDQVVYVPGGETFDSPAVLAEFVFDGPETIPVGIPDTAAWQKTAPESLIGLWKMDKISGETIPDFSGHSLNGRLVNGPALKKGGDRKDSIRLSDELRQSVDIKGSPDLNLKAPFSLSIWICYEPTRTWYPAIMGKGYGNEAEKGGGYSLHLRPDNSVWFELDTEDGERKIYNPTERPVAPGEWTHAAATYDGKIMRVYVNGREAGKGLAAENVVLRRTSQPLRIGWLGSWGWFNGSIRNASIYSRSLSPAEIFAEYLSGK